MTSQSVFNGSLSSYPVTVVRLADNSLVQNINAILPFISKVDTASATVTYTGYALRGSASSAAAWFIFKDEVSGTVTTRTMASAPWAFTQVWDNRAALTYS